MLQNAEKHWYNETGIMQKCNSSILRLQTQSSQTTGVEKLTMQLKNTF